jgi:hypothetical protein
MANRRTMGGPTDPIPKPEAPTSGKPGTPVPPPADAQTTAVVVAGASLAEGRSAPEAVATGIATAGFAGATNADAEYQRSWKARRAEAHGWRKIWAFIWG